MSAGMETAVAGIETERRRRPLLLGARRWRRWEAADTVIAVSLGLVIVIVSIFALLSVQAYSALLDGARTRGQAAANIVAEETRWVISSTLTLTSGAAGAFDGDPTKASADTLRRFTTVTAHMPTVLALGIYGPTGTKIADASSPQVLASIADTDYFRAVANGAEWTISAQETDAASGKAMFSVIHRLGTPQAFSGAVVIAIDASVLENFAAPQDLGAGSTISIVRNDGWVIARLPSLTAPLNISGTASFDNLTSADIGTYTAISAVDGTERLVSFRHVDDLGYIAIASVSTATALAALWSSIFIVSCLIGPIAVALLIGSFITARLLRRTQATSRSLATALEHNEVLFREIHHRVKNNLQSVASLLQMQPIPREIKADMGQRITAMSAVHEHIYRSNNFATVRVKDYLHTLIESIRAGQAADVRVIEQFDDLWVDKDAATPIGLIVNEVASNAFKHAFTDGRAGVVTVRLTRLDDGRGCVTVEDNGVGFDPSQPGKGIGRRLITALTTQLGGESEFLAAGDGGSKFTLSFPVVANA